MEICIKVFFLLPSKKEMFAYNSPFRIFFSSDNKHAQMMCFQA